MKIQDFFYTEQQAAEALGVKPITIWRRIKAGSFNIERIGKMVLIPKWEVELVKAANMKHNKRKKKVVDN